METQSAGRTQPTGSEAQSFCTQCGHKLLASDGFCARCGTAQLGDRTTATPANPGAISEKPQGELKVLVALMSTALALLFIGLIVTGEIPGLGFDLSNRDQVNTLMVNVKNDVAADTEREFALASRSGTKIDKCVAAEMAAGAYLQAHDSDNYGMAISRRNLLCAAAGMPPQ